MKWKIIAIIVIASFIPLGNVKAMSKQTEIECCKVEKTISKRYGKNNVKFYKSKNLTSKTLKKGKGKGKYIVEIINGTVDNPKTGDGHSRKWYICYKRVKGIRKGTKVRSYLIYNPKTNATDDVIARYDVVTKY